MQSKLFQNIKEMVEPFMKQILLDNSPKMIGIVKNENYRSIFLMNIDTKSWPMKSNISKS